MNRGRYNNDKIRDYGSEPLIVNIDRFAKMNTNYRTALWTGEQLQVTLMSIPPGGDIGVERHTNLDQFIRIESGYALIAMGDDKNNLNYQRKADQNFALVVPAGTWHNLVNIGRTPLKLYSIYAPTQHPYGTVHKTKKDAEHP